VRPRLLLPPPDASSRPLWVFHLPADMGGMGYLEDNAEVLSTNALVTTNAVRAAQAAGADVLFFASSECVYPVTLQVVHGGGGPLALLLRHPAFTTRTLGLLAAAGAGCVLADLLVDLYVQLVHDPSRECSSLPFLTRVGGVVHGLAIRTWSEAGRIGKRGARRSGALVAVPPLQLVRGHGAGRRPVERRGVAARNIARAEGRGANAWSRPHSPVYLAPS
jgi:hypothetical protein